MNPPVGPLATATAQARAREFAAACARADCRYADPRRPASVVDRDHAAECTGWAASVYLEPEGPVLRWRRCPRFAPWWRAERDRLQERRAREAREKAAARHAPRAWADEGER